MMLFVCDVEGCAVKFEDNHILTAVNVFDMFQLRNLKGTPTVCEIEVYGNLVICHALPENQGKSIVNLAETLALSVCFEFDIDIHDVIWIEHHPKEVRQLFGKTEEKWDRVFFNIIKDDEGEDTFGRPRWQEMTREDVERLISRYRPE